MNDGLDSRLGLVVREHQPRGIDSLTTFAMHRPIEHFSSLFQQQLNSRAFGIEQLLSRNRQMLGHTQPRVNA